MALLLTLAGAALIVISLRDIFHELFHPSGRGSLSRVAMRSLWRLFRLGASRYPALLNIAGPATMISIIACWAMLLCVGWALVLWPHLPEGFLLSTGLTPSKNGSFLDALYVSLTTLTTLGYGDIAPRNTPLRVLMPLEALVGFGLLTVSISWVLSIYPVLSRRRSLAQRVLSLARAEAETGLRAAQESPQTLADLASELVTLRNDLIQFPITYYFHGDENDSLSTAMPHLIQLARDLGPPAEVPANTRLHAATLQQAMEGLASTLSDLFLDLPYSPPEVIAKAYAQDHLHTTRKT